MKMKFALVSLGAICLLAVALPALAHHSHGNYDVAKWTSLEGTVKEVHLLVPHSWIYLTVKDDKGQTSTWALEATGPEGLKRKGIDKTFLKIGDSIKARCHQLKDGTNGCLLGFVTPTHGDSARGHGVEVEWD
jgi:hypothetical protein